jgi:glycosyltransferase involved in cell wall biosynthesis
VRSLSHRVPTDDVDFPLDFSDIADSRRLDLPVPSEGVARDRALRIGFLSTPPAVGSGGHTTLFRMVTALEAAGHECTLFLYDRYGGDVQQHELAVRKGWPDMRARVVDAADGIAGVDACVASGWPTAHVLATRGVSPMRRLYLVQDFEPYFYGHGTEYVLAEDSYRFGFRCITIGHWGADQLREQTQVEAEVITYGCDHSVYRLEGGRSRDGVVFYTRPGVPRRGYVLGMLALEQFHRLRPDTPIHLVGASGVTPRFQAVRHGKMTPSNLAALYNGVVAGLVLSFTNVSLVPDELLACGVVPVLNESENRSDITSDGIHWARPTPAALADALIDVLDSPPSPAAVAATAKTAGWAPAEAEFVRLVEDETYRPC